MPSQNVRARPTPARQFVGSCIELLQPSMRGRAEQVHQHTADPTRKDTNTWAQAPRKTPTTRRRGNLTSWPRRSTTV
jgi:hypothetical protein